MFDLNFWLSLVSAFEQSIGYWCPVECPCRGLYNKVTLLALFNFHFGIYLFLSGVNLNANASEWEVSHKKNPMKYNSYSAACAEVQVLSYCWWWIDNFYCAFFGDLTTFFQVDTLTGEVTVLRTDIVFDCGTSLNPILDMGQVQVWKTGVKRKNLFFSEEISKKFFFNIYFLLITRVDLFKD